MPRPRKSPLLPFVAFAALAASSTGCGYHSTLGPREPLPAATNASTDASANTSTRPRPIAERARISITALRSDSPEPWLDRIVTDALRRELGTRATLRLVDDPDDAAMAVHGRIRPLDVTSRSFSSFVAALEYSLTLALDLDVQLENGTVVKLDPAMLSETDSYLASPDIEVTRTNRLEALRRISDLLAARVADSLELIDRPMPGEDAPPAAAPQTPSTSPLPPAPSTPTAPVAPAVKAGAGG